METLTWEVFEPYLRGKTPSALNMGGTRNVRIGFNPTSESMFIRLPIEPNSTIPPSPYSEISLDRVKDEAGFVLEIRTKTLRLFREFHRFAGFITEEFEQSGKTALGAFETAIIRWRELTLQKKLLTEEQQLGLQGELTFLRALINIYGEKSISAWTGRNKSLPERHDFRVDNIDIEIKSTRSSRRSHIIHGLGQLQPSLGRTLYLLSMKFQDAGLGRGQSLYDEINNIRLKLGDNKIERKEFEDRLLAAGYQDIDSVYYQEKFIFADEPMLISVDENFPKITTEILSNSITPELIGRLDDVTYRVDIEGLGTAQGSDEFSKILGEVHLEVK